MTKLHLNSPYLTASSLRDYVKSIELGVSVQEGRPSVFEKIKRKLLGIGDLTHYSQLVIAVNHIIETEELKTTEDKQLLLAKLNAITDWNAPAAEEQFTNRNTMYGYYNIPPKAEELHLFCELTMRCYAIIRLYEDSIDEQLAYDYAYKLMALFVDDINKKPIEQWTDELAKHMVFLEKSFESGTLKPYHDTFVVRLPHLLNASKIHDYSGWRAFLLKYGVPAFPYFIMADKIEGKNDQIAPETFKQAQEIAAECNYTRSSEDIEFARLCNQYKVTEERYNQCLDYLQSGWPKKLTDTLPDISVTKGKFTWSKLAVADKRGLILGDITDCCQSIGGHSEQCVKDAVSLHTSGLYILKDGNKIIGQAYIWISQTGNLCLDSIECLPHSINDDELKSILHRFATDVLATHTEIKRVAIGAGGKTPRCLFPDTALVEKLTEGAFYGDAEMQYCIMQSDPLPPERRLELNALLQIYSQSFQECINYFCNYLSTTETVVEELRALLEKNPSFSDVFSPGSLMCYLSMMRKYNQKSITLRDFTPIDFSTEEYLHLPLATRAVRLMNQATSTTKLFELLPYIPESYRADALSFIYGGEFSVGTLLECNIENSAMISTIITLCPKEHFFRIAKPALGRAVTCSSPESLEMLLKELSQNQCFDVVTEQNSSGKTLLHEAIRYPYSFAALLRPLSTAQRIEAIKIKDNEGRSILYCVAAIEKQKKPFLANSVVKSPFEIILKTYSQNELIKDLKEVHDFGKTILHQAVKGGNLIAILKVIPENQCAASLDANDDAGKSVLYYEIMRVKDDSKALENLFIALSLDSFILLTPVLEEVNLPFTSCKDLMMKAIKKKPSCSLLDLDSIFCANDFSQLRKALNLLIDYNIYAKTFDGNS